MKFTLSWLHEHLDTKAPPAELAHAMTMVGLEVESVEEPSPLLKDFIVARVVAAEKHPQADRLKVCRVETGAGEIQVVCGAPNAHAGMLAVLARPGVTIPATGEKLKKGSIRGVESQGMLCSARELGLGEDHDGIIDLPEGSPVGASALDVLGADALFDVSITPNRADCLGVRGIARDLAAAGFGTFKPLDVPTVPGHFPSPIAVALDFAPTEEAACPLFVGRYIRGVRNGDSPDWLKARLAAVGLRPISALVDITNLLALDQARPLHVFDADKLAGDLTVRMARVGEGLAALNGKTYDLGPGQVVIADAAGPQALGGVIGGEATGCTAATVNVFLESALFDPARIAAAGRALGIESDARYRFERGVDPATALPGAERATALILDLCGGTCSDLVVAGAEPSWRRTIRLRPERLERIAGVAVPRGECERILAALGCMLAEQPDVILAAPPSWRRDLDAEHDLIEEVVRIHGFDKVPAATLPRPPLPAPALTLAQRRRGWVRRTLAGRGLMETVTWSFLPSAQARLFGGGQAELVLANPISSDLDAMRPSLLPNLIAAAGRNAAHDMPDAGLFEIGPAFHGGEPGEQKMLAAGLRAGATGPRHWAAPPRAVDVFDAKADALAVLAAAGAPADRVQIVADAPAWYHPGRSGTLRLGPTVLGWFGEVHPKVARALDVKGALAAFEVILDVLPVPKAAAGRARPLLKVPTLHPVERDFAFAVDAGVPAEALVKAARGADKALIVEVAVFDVYEGPSLGPGRKSLAVGVTLQPTEKALTDAEIDAISQKVVDAVAAATGATLRA